MPWTIGNRLAHSQPVTASCHCANHSVRSMCGQDAPAMLQTHVPRMRRRTKQILRPTAFNLVETAIQVGCQAFGHVKPLNTCEADPSHSIDDEAGRILVTLVVCAAVDRGGGRREGSYKIKGRGRESQGDGEELPCSSQHM